MTETKDDIKKIKDHLWPSPQTTPPQQASAAPQSGTTFVQKPADQNTTSTITSPGPSAPTQPTAPQAPVMPTPSTVAPSITAVMPTPPQQTPSVVVVTPQPPPQPTTTNGMGNCDCPSLLEKLHQVNQKLDEVNNKLGNLPDKEWWENKMGGLYPSPEKSPPSPGSDFVPNAPTPPLGPTLPPSSQTIQPRNKKGVEPLPSNRIASVAKSTQWRKIPTSEVCVPWGTKTPHRKFLEVDKENVIRNVYYAPIQVVAR